MEENMIITFIWINIIALAIAIHQTIFSRREDESSFY